MNSVVQTGGEISRVGEEDDPLALEVLREVDGALGGLGLERRGLLTDQRHPVLTAHAQFP